MFYDEFYNRLDLQFEIVDLYWFDRHIWLDVSFLFLHVYELKEMIYVVIVCKSSPAYLRLGFSKLSIGNTTSLLYNKKNGENLVDSLILNRIAAKV